MVNTPDIAAPSAPADKEALEDLGRQADNLAGSITSNSSTSDINAVVAQLANLQARAAGLNADASVTNRIAQAVAEMEKKYSAELSEDAQDAIEAANAAMPSPRLSRRMMSQVQNALFSENSPFTNTRERDYLRSIDPNTHYNGVSGETLREDVTRIKLHTLAPTQQEELTGIKPTPEQSKDEMNNLKESLSRIEAFEAGKGNHRHEQFKHAHKNADAVIEKSEQVSEREKQAQLLMVQSVTGNFMATLALQGVGKDIEVAKEGLAQEKEKLRETLQKDIIDGALLEKTEPARSSQKEATIPIALAPEGNGHGLHDGVRKARESGAGISV